MMVSGSEDKEVSDIYGKVSVQETVLLAPSGMATDQNGTIPVT